MYISLYLQILNKLKSLFVELQNRFALNISDKKDGGDILFHLNPRPAECICIRNSFIGGNWGEEEKWLPDFPFTNGKSFTLKIEVTKDAFRTLVNGKMFVDFKHRTDFRKGKFLVLREGADYYDVTHQQRAVSCCFFYLFIFWRVNELRKTIRDR